MRAALALWLGTIVISAGCSSKYPETTSSASDVTAPQFDLNTLAGKNASLRATADPEIRFSATVEAAGDGDTDADHAGLNDGVIDAPPSLQPNPVALDGTSIAAPAVTVNLDKGAAPQNETSIAVDPGNPNRLVASANDYVTGTWSCFIAPGMPCSAIADGYSGTYFSNDGGKTWCCNSSDPAHIGTLIPGVQRLTGGQYDAGGDPAVAFDSRGNVYYAGLGFNRLSAPNTVAVNRGTFDASGHLSWGAPTFIGQTNAPAIIDDKEWIAADANASSPFRDRVYVTFTRFIFNPAKGNYVQSPIMAAVSSDGGQTFSEPQIIGAPAIYSQGSRPAVAPDGTVYVFFDGFIRNTPFRAIYVTKSTDGGQSFGPPVKVADRRGIGGIRNTLFRVNSFPAAAVAPDGTIYASWSANYLDSATTYGPEGFCSTTAPIVGCHSVAVLSKSTDGGSAWSAPAPFNAAVDAQNRTPIGTYTGTGITPN
ncbi:MAG TPA: sialidase family protein, partial [Myxococcales bacterium]